jgi:transposase-like protein
VYHHAASVFNNGDLNSMSTAENPPSCPNCGYQMKLDGILPAVPGNPELQTFKCEKCGSVFTDTKEN